MSLAYLPGYEHSDDIYEVEKIVDCEKRNGVYVYRVRWKGCPRDQDTWEPEENLLTCDDLLTNFKLHREERKKKLKQKRKEMRNEFIRNSIPLSIKVKDEEEDDDDDYSDSDNEEVNSGKKKTPSNLSSPASDMDEIDLSGLTRKQRLAVQKVIEQSKKDAELSSPASSTASEESEQYKRVTFTKKPQNETTTSGEGKPRKKKKVLKAPVINETSEESENEDNNTNVRNTEESLTSTAQEPQGAAEGPKDITHANISNEDVETNRTKKPSEILGNIFGTPTKSVEPATTSVPSSPNVFANRLLSSPPHTIPSSSSLSHNRIPSSPNTALGRIPSSLNLSSILCLSDDSSDDRCLDKLSKQGSVIEQDYVPLLDQLQMRMDPMISSSMFQTSIELDEPKIPIPENPYINAIELGELNTSVPVSIPLPSPSRPPTFEKERLQIAVPVPYSSILDIGCNKRTYIKGVENIRNTLAMKRMLMNPDITGNTDKKRKEDIPEKNVNVLPEHPVERERAIERPVERPVERERAIERPVERPVERERAIERPVERPVERERPMERPIERPVERVRTLERPVERLVERPVQARPLDRSVSTKESSYRSLPPLRRSTSDTGGGGNVQRARQVISSFSLSSRDKKDSDSRSDPRSVPRSEPRSDPRLESRSEPAVDFQRSNSIPERGTSESSSYNTARDSFRTSDQKASSSKLVDPRMAARPLGGSGTSKSSSKSRPMLQKSVSSPAVPNAMKMSRNEKLLNAMKSNSSSAPKRPEKSKKLSLKEYNAKKAKQNVQAHPTGPILEFTKIPPAPPPVPAPSPESLPQKFPCPYEPMSNQPPPPKQVERRISMEKKEKVHKLNQYATNTDVIGNIMQCFKQPLGRDSNNRMSLDKGSPLFPKRKKSGHPEALDLEALTDELDDYSGDEDGVLRSVAENTVKTSHLNLPHANTKVLDLLAIYQTMLRGDIDSLIRCDIREDKINAFVDEQDTLLMKAVMLRNTSAAQILLEKKADPNKKSKHGPRHGKTPLMFAVEMNQRSMVSLFVQNNARINTQTKTGETALIIAGKMGHMEIIHVLLNSGADVKPASTYLEKKMSEVPINLLPELQRTLHNRSEKLKEVTEKFLKDLLNSRTTQLGKSLMPIRCVSPDELDEHEFYFKCNLNAVEPRVHVLFLALPVSCRRNGHLDVKFAIEDNGVKNVYLNDGQMPPTCPNASFLYFLFPKFGEINTLRIESSKKGNHKLLVSIYSMTSERVDKTAAHMNQTRICQQAAANAAVVPVH